MLSSLFLFSVNRLGDVFSGSIRVLVIGGIAVLTGLLLPTKTQAAPFLQETFYEGAVPYSQTASGGMVRADHKTQKEIRHFRERLDRFGIGPIAPTPAVRRLRAAIDVKLPSNPSPDEVWEASRRALNWLYFNIAPGNQGYIDMMGQGGWPTADRIADYWGGEGKLAWAACFSKAHLAFQLFRIVGLPIDDFGIASAHYKNAEGRTTPTHVYLGLRVGKEWFYIDPGTQRDIGDYAQRASVGGPLMQQYGPGVDYEHPYSFKTVGGPGRFIGVPLLGKPRKKMPSTTSTQGRQAKTVRSTGVASTTLIPGTVNLPFFALESGKSKAQTIGCGDSVRTVRVKVPQGRDPLRYIINFLLRQGNALASRYGLYHPLANSSLTVDKITMQGEEVIVELSGQFSIGGICDTPRVMAQLEHTVLQFPQIKKVRFYINDVIISALLDQR